jgi:hypothetical protein
LQLNGRQLQPADRAGAGRQQPDPAGRGEGRHGRERSPTASTAAAPNTTAFSVDGSETLNVGINRDHSSRWSSTPSIDAIQEIKVLTSNYGAQYPSTGNGTTIVTTKSGTDDSYHGSLYEFLRNAAFNAKGYFDVGKKRAALPSATTSGARSAGRSVDSPPVRRQGQDPLLLLRGGPAWRRLADGLTAKAVPFAGGAQRRLQRRLPGGGQRDRQVTFSPARSTPIAPMRRLSGGARRSRSPSLSNQMNYSELWQFNGSNHVVTPILSPNATDAARTPASSRCPTRAQRLQLDRLGVLQSSDVPLPYLLAARSCSASTIRDQRQVAGQLPLHPRRLGPDDRRCPQYAFTQNSLPTIQNRFLCARPRSLVGRLTGSVLADPSSTSSWL